MEVIKSFDDLYDAILFLETEAERGDEYFKAELLKTSDNRWRVGIITEAQIDLFDGVLE